MGRIEAVLQLIEKRVRQNKSQVIGLISPQQLSTLGGLRVKLIKPAVEESLQASQGCLFSLPDHKEPHSPIDVEEAYVGLTVHRANSEKNSESTGW